MKSRRLKHYFIVAIMLSIGARSSVMAQVITGPNVNISDIPGPQSEVGLAVDPTNPLNIIVVANEIMDITKLGVWYSLDGGETWTANFVDENADGFGADDHRFDPNVAFDSDGNVYVVYSTTGTGNRVALVRSSDGGQNYDQVTTVTTDAGSNHLHTSMVTTRSDAGADAVLVVWARVHPHESIEAALSLDAGASFPIQNNDINDALQRTFVPWAVADAAGDFHVVWEVNQGSGTGIIQHDVLNGVTLADGANTTVTTIEITDFVEPTSAIPAQPDRGIFSVATVDVDRVTGRVYLSYTDRLNSATDDTDIYVRFSDNNGADWSARIQVNDDATTTSQFMPRMVVDRTSGVVVAIWYDAREDVVNNGLVDIFTSVSRDGGVTWSLNQRVTTAQSDESVNNPLRYLGNYLEYIGLTAHAGVAYVSWTDARDDNFNSGTNEDVYSAVINLNILSCDIKPGSCPNSFNRSSNGVLPVALVGTMDFDVNEVDLSTVRLSRADGVGGEVAPHEGPPGPHTTIEDVSAPFDGKEACDCENSGPDGVDDLSMKFRTTDLVDALELDDLNAGDLVTLVLSGNLLDGAMFASSDCIRLVPSAGPPGLMAVESDDSNSWINASPLDWQLDGGGFGTFARSYPLGTVVTLEANPMHFVGWKILGQFVSTSPRLIWPVTDNAFRVHVVYRVPNGNEFVISRTH